MLCDLKGQIERITYSNEENGYTIARMKVRGEHELVTVVGNFMSLMPGEILVMKGEWDNHPRYGRQFRVVEYRTSVPASVYGIQKYLGSGLIKGIGPVMAKRIVGIFGEKTLAVIEERVEQLVTVPGIGPKRIQMIRQAWNDQKEIRQVMIFLQEHGVSAGYATKIFKAYGVRATKIMQENPYRLAMDISGIGFVTADRIAEKLGFPKQSALRAQAGILYVLMQATEDGHVYYPCRELMAKARELLALEEEPLAEALSAIALEKRVVIEDLTRDAADFQQEDKAVYLAPLHFCEVSSAQRIGALAAGANLPREVDPDKAIAWVEGRMSGLTLADKQKEAVRAALSKKLLIITGGPGTGKTTIVNAIVKIFLRMGARIQLAAPTGRAAKRMMEATNVEARTIHRMLSFSPARGGFQKNEDSPLECDLLIVDEASMIDVVLMHHLLKALPQDAGLILVGDVFQLPPVGPGCPFQDMLQSGTVPVSTLSEIFRQARQSLIVVNAHLIHQGKLPMAAAAQGRLEDFYFISKEDPEEVLRLIVELVTKRIPERFGFDPLQDIQVLTPMHRGPVGATNLNQVLQTAINPEGDSLVWGSRTLRVGDKVMQIRNDYDRDVYNGDMGVIEKIDREEQKVTVLLEGRRVQYDYGDLDEIVPAYAVSVHKAQGSEYPAVVLPLLPQHYMLLQRNLLYTAVTRGRKLVVVVGSPKALAMAVRNDRTQRRYSDMKNRLRSLFAGRVGR